MKVLNLVQGSDEWLEARLNHFTASEAAAMMGDSKYMSRKQLLDLKTGWKSNPVDDFKKRLFEKGHESEAAARPHAEMEVCDDLPPMVGSVVVGDLELLASFDGLSIERLPWEHKEWNEVLAENVRNGLLEPMYYWQLEHQMLVAAASQAMFTVSDGTYGKRVSMRYESVPERREQLIAGWVQFDKDLADHELEAKQELMPAKDVEALPSVTFRVEGSMIVSNISDCLGVIRDRAEQEMAITLETDQDFADKDKLNKATKAARAKLKQVLADVQGRFVSHSEFVGVAKEIDSVLQKMQSHGEKQVKIEKERKKKSIFDAAESALSQFVQESQSRIAPISLGEMYPHPDFTAAMRNRRTIDGLQEAVDVELARVKILINQLVSRISANLVVMRKLATDYKFLFSDTQQIISQEIEPFTAIVKQRIADHKEAEARRLEGERKRIQEEEERKAREKVQREAADQARAEKVEADRVAAEKLAAEQLKAEQVVDESKPDQEAPPASVPDVAKAARIFRPKQDAPTLQSELGNFCSYYDLPKAAVLQLKSIIGTFTQPIDERRTA